MVTGLLVLMRQKAGVRGRDRERGRKAPCLCCLKTLKVVSIPYRNI